METLENKIVDEVNRVESDVELAPEVDQAIQEESTEDQNEVKGPEPWMETEETTDEQTSGSVPVSTHIKAKQKLKGKISERDEEITTLRSELEALRNRTTQPAATSQLKRPSEFEFDNDDEYQAAVDAYEDARIENKLNEKQQKAALTASRQALDDAVSSHFVRAEKLVRESGISPELYQSSDKKLRLAIESIYPGKGDAIVDHHLAILGEGSEKVSFYIGNNEAARMKYQSLMAEDPSGLRASVYLGEEKARLLGYALKNKTSKAPEPAPNATGGSGSVNDGESRMKKQYYAAKSDQEMFNIRREARLKGFDVKKW
jgi:hypothetical protein